MALKSLEEMMRSVDFVEMVSAEKVSDSSNAIVSAGMGSPEVLLKSGWHGEQIYAFEKADIVDFKNENMIAWKNNKPIAMVPDSICWITTDGISLTNADIREGMVVAVIGKKAHLKFRDEKIYSMFTHIFEFIGYLGEFKPIEELV